MNKIKDETKKVIFLDIDGTLVNDHNAIPESAKEAVAKARANGHYVFICTGRATSQVVGPVKTLELDGRVCSAGGYVEMNGKVIREKYMTKEDVEFIVNYMESKRICYCLEAPNGAFVCKRTKQYFRDIIAARIERHPEKKQEIEEGFQAFVDIMIDDEDMIRTDITKVTFFGSEVAYEEIEAAFKGRFEILPNSVKLAQKNGGEIMLPGVHKATGIQAVLDELKLDKANSFAYGDGLNDLEMIQFVAHGIAMGNACEALKKVATDVTDDVEKDGLFKSFKKYGLI